MPVAGLVQGRDGNFYGTTQEGGVANNDGTVFKISPSGSLTILWTFIGAGDGGQPKAGLVQGSDGNFYGTTSRGGTNSDIFGSRLGTVFQLNINGSLTTLTTLHTFTNNPDGAEPAAGLVQGSLDGYLYGTTIQGGVAINYGTVFRISPSGSSYAIPHSFTNNPDGGEPVAGLVQGSDGNFYGTTESGGTNGGGTVFQLNTNGSLTILHSFNTSVDGSPLAGLAQGADGNFYGTTYNAGAHSGGTVFRIGPGGNYATVYSFNSNLGDGTAPFAGLVQGSDGNFYGTTKDGGSHGYGTVFRISASGSFSNLYSFTAGSDGAEPVAGLMQGSDGNFYGTTGGGGPTDHGNVFKVIVPLNPPANQISALQIAGTNVLVTLPSVAGEIYQLQYRTSLTVGAWSNVEGQVTSIGGSLTVTNFGGFSQSQQFYRFAITP
jgi:uncharacterized repeat protein (TIGR03803 family)